ncbi:MAG: FUSC family protein [Synechococcaceae cyanobacterium]
MDPPLLRQSVRWFVAALFTASVAIWSERITFVWYPLLAVVFALDDDDEHTTAAVMARILGTITGGLITFLVHTILSGWMGVLVSLVLMVPVLRFFGWQSALGTAGTVCVVFLMIRGHVDLNWRYVLDRSLDTALGCAIALAVSLLLWPRHGYDELRAADQRLRERIRRRLVQQRGELARGGAREAAADAGSRGAALEQMERLVERERGGPGVARLQRSGWERRLRLWQLALFHWSAWERLWQSLPPIGAGQAPLLEHSLDGLLAQLAGEGRRTPGRHPQAWRELAEQQGLPLLPLLALAEELAPLHASLRALGRWAPC